MGPTPSSSMAFGDYHPVRRMTSIKLGVVRIYCKFYYFVIFFCKLLKICVLLDEYPRAVPITFAFANILVLFFYVYACVFVFICVLCVCVCVCAFVCVHLKL